MEEITACDIQQLLEYFSRNTYKAKETDPKSQDVMQTCLNLVTLDYSNLVINNGGGELSAHYPSQLIVLEYELPAPGPGCSRTVEGSSTRTTSTIYESMYDVGKLRELFGKARFARCRARFPLPVILYRGKHICRSATLSGGPEIYGRSGFDYFFSGSENAPDDEGSDISERIPHAQSDWQLFDRVRSQDIRLLKTLNVGTIVDFMVEKKKVKFGMNVTSSEKVDKENRYSDFTIISLPYPGCEFFKEYRDNNYVAKGLVFDWMQAHVDATIGVPDDPVSAQLKIDWNNYKMWDLVKLTQNYLKLLLRYLQENSSGLLIHCISGWDRTPLFISLLRLSLWADGTVHQSLNACQILYLTIAYDWMLFGHNLEDRLGKGEEIFFFCFDFLKHVTGDEFSVTARPRSRHVLRNDSDAQLDALLLEGDAGAGTGGVGGLAGGGAALGSNVSLNSSCSSQSSRSQDCPPTLFHTAPDAFEEPSNGNVCERAWAFEYPAGTGTIVGPGPRSPLASRTSPVAVPAPPSGAANRLRQRNDSGSSLSAGSWQLISGTGSLRGSASASVTALTGDSSTPNSQSSSHPSLCEGTFSAESSTTVIEDDCFLFNTTTTTTTTSTVDTPCYSISQRQERLQAVRSLFYSAYCSTIGFKFKGGQDSSLGSLLGNFAEKVGFISAQRTSV